MTKQQEFQETVGQVIQADNVTQILAGLGRPLTSRERKDLNDKVNRLGNEFGQPGGKTWRSLHDAIGVENIEGMRIEHLRCAHAILDLQLERAELMRDRDKRSSSADELVAMTACNSDLIARLDEAQAARTHAERALTTLRSRCQHSESAERKARERANRLLVYLVLAIALAAGTGYIRYDHVQRVTAIMDGRGSAR